MGRILAQIEERLAIGLGDAPDHRVVALRQQPADRLRQRQPDDRQRPLARRRRDAVRREGAVHRRHDHVLAIDDGAVAIEDDEVHGRILARQFRLASVVIAIEAVGVEAEQIPRLASCAAAAAR